MRLAVIADIHGNLPALEAVLADAEGRGAERVVVNGDMVNRGPDGSAVLRRLAGLGLPMTLGNHDDLMRSWTERDPALPPWFDAPVGRGFAWCAHRLERDGWLELIASLPLLWRLEPADAPSLLVTHGSPRHYREGYGSHLRDDAIAEIVRDWPADVLVGSHTHRPLERSWGDHQLLNTGAVGAPFNGDPRAQYLLLDLEGGRWSWEFRRVDYDRDAALDAFRSSGFLDEGDLGAHIFYQELRCARSLLTPFLIWLEREGEAQGWESWRAFAKRAGDRLRPARAVDGA